MIRHLYTLLSNQNMFLKFPLNIVLLRTYFELSYSEYPLQPLACVSCRRAAVRESAKYSGKWLPY